MASKRTTDLHNLKDIAIAMLYTDIRHTKLSPIVVKHPFTDSGVVGLKDAESPNGVTIFTLTSPEAVSKWRQHLHGEIMKAKTPGEVLRFVTNCYKLTAIKYFEPHMSRRDLSLALQESWTLIENISMDINVSAATVRALSDVP